MMKAKIQKKFAISGKSISSNRSASLTLFHADLPSINEVKDRMNTTAVASIGSLSKKN